MALAWVCLMALLAMVGSHGATEQDIAQLADCAPGLTIVCCHSEACRLLNLSSIHMVQFDIEHHRCHRQPCLVQSQRTSINTFAFKASTNKDLFVAGLNRDNYKTTLQMISGAKALTFSNQRYTINTRYTLGNELEHVSDFWADLCLQYGYEVLTQDFEVNRALARNVICRKMGTSNTLDGRVVVGAHYDSISEDPMNKAPGAVDNGSGSAAVATMLQQAANFKFNASIDFVFFSGEEQGLYGSKHYVSELSDPVKDVSAALIMDMIAFINETYGLIVECDKSKACASLQQVMAANCQHYSPQMALNLKDFAFGSDHVPFQRAGIASFLAIEGDDTEYLYYHTTQDTMASVSLDLAMNITAGMAATLADTALIESPDI